MATKRLTRQFGSMAHRKDRVMSIRQSINRWFVGVLAVAAAASAIGLAPTASAKGTVLPRESCTGAGIVADSCEAPPQPVPTHLLTPHGSQGGKIAIAAERDLANSTSDSSTQSDHRSSTPAQYGSSTSAQHGSSTHPHQGSPTPPHHGSSTSAQHGSSTHPHQGSPTPPHHRPSTRTHHRS
jgi:hypothetical protein